MSSNEFDKLSLKTSPDLLSSLLSEERPITVDEACSLRLLLFGNTSSTFGEEWTAQGFCFKPRPISYGLIQKRAGPCGVLAAVQANVLFEMLFGSSNIPLDSGLLRPKLIDKRRALSQALCSILWQAGERKSAVYAVRRKTVIIDDSIAENVLKKDGLLEYLHLKYFKSKDDLLEFLYNFISEMMQTDCEGCVLFLYSVILTHGIDKIKKEMDVPESHLIGNDGYCSQEIVNLLLTGKAVPNLFDGDLELNSGGPEISLLRGISKRSKIGLLSSYEYKNTCAIQ